MDTAFQFSEVSTGRIGERSVMEAAIGTLDVNIEVRRHGWGLIEIQTDSDDLSLVFSCAFDDPIEKIIEFSDALIRGLDGSILLYDEPGGHLIEYQFAKDGLEGNFSVRKIDEPWSRFDSGELIFNKNLGAALLISLLIGNLARLSICFGEERFRKDRRAFPEQKFCRLFEDWRSSALKNNSSLRA